MRFSHAATPSSSHGARETNNVNGPTSSTRAALRGAASRNASMDARSVSGRPGGDLAQVQRLVQRLRRPRRACARPRATCRRCRQHP